MISSIVKMDQLVQKFVFGTYAQNVDPVSLLFPYRRKIGIGAEQNSIG
jgi:hypothetical protein